MTPFPLHPAVVHIPIGLAAVLPVVALGAVIAIHRGWVGKRVWLAVLFLQAITFGGGLLSASTGENDRRQTVMIVGSGPLDEHEEQGERFNVTAGIALALGVAGAFPGPTAAITTARIASAIGTGASAALGFYAGHSGGELVYRYGAANAFTSKR